MKEVGWTVHSDKRGVQVVVWECVSSQMSPQTQPTNVFKPKHGQQKQNTTKITRIKTKETTQINNLRC